MNAARDGYPLTDFFLGERISISCCGMVYICLNVAILRITHLIAPHQVRGRSFDTWHKRRANEADGRWAESLVATPRIPSQFMPNCQFWASYRVPRLSPAVDVKITMLPFASEHTLELEPLWNATLPI